MPSLLCEARTRTCARCHETKNRSAFNRNRRFAATSNFDKVCRCCRFDEAQLRRQTKLAVAREADTGIQAKRPCPA